MQTSAAVHEEVRVAVPNMGDSVSEGTIVEFQKKPGRQFDIVRLQTYHCPALFGLAHERFPAAGDVVNEDDVLVQIETDKVTIDVRYTESQPGTIKEFLVSADDTVTVGQEVVVVNKGEVPEGKAHAWVARACHLNLATVSLDMVSFPTHGLSLLSRRFRGGAKRGLKTRQSGV